jgi:hypothetical protein
MLGLRSPLGSPERFLEHVVREPCAACIEPEKPTGFILIFGPDLSPPRINITPATPMCGDQEKRSLTTSSLLEEHNQTSLSNDKENLTLKELSLLHFLP